jgi:hypothetical protein
MILALTLGTAVTGQGQKLIIQTENGKRSVLERSDLEALPHIKVTTRVSDLSATFEGVTVKAVLQKAGVSFDHVMKGKRLAACLLVEAADGYRGRDCPPGNRSGIHR